jgi:uncharacterized protein (DUF2267 family)
MRKAAIGVLAVAAAAAVAAVVLGRDSKAGRTARRGLGQAGKKARYAAGRLQGVKYRVTGGHPDPAVPDDVLADRIRSGLGPLEHRLDVPRVHVMVEQHVALLHGEVPSVTDRAAIERAVLDTPGVRGLESYLHVGLTPGSTRPSAGRAEAAKMPSAALRELLDAATEAGAPGDRSLAAVRAVLGAFAGRIPEGEREQLLAHLPADVRELAAIPSIAGDALARMRTVEELVQTVTAPSLTPDQGRAVVEAVVTHVRRLVPEEAADVEAVLPAELRRLWTEPVPG